MFQTSRVDTCRVYTLDIMCIEVRVDIQDARRGRTEIFHVFFVTIKDVHRLKIESRLD